MSLCDRCIVKKICPELDQKIKTAQGSCLSAEVKVQGKFRTGELETRPDGKTRFINLSRVPSIRKIHHPVDILR